MEIHFTAVRGSKGSKDCVAVPAVARLVLAHTALKPVGVSPGRKKRTQRADLVSW